MYEFVRFRCGLFMERLNLKNSPTLNKEEQYMPDTKQLIQCVPNFSEGRNLEKIETIVNAFRGKQGVKLLDYQSDADHNRTVVTVLVC